MNVVPLMPIDEYASKAINKLLNSTRKNATKSLTEFFEYANNHNIQGPAITSYYSELNFRKKHRKELSNVAKQRIFGISKIIKGISNKSEKLKEEQDKFVKALKVNYPKTLDKRIALLNKGEVVSGKVKKSSGFNKFVVKTSVLVKNLLNTNN